MTDGFAEAIANACDDVRLTTIVEEVCRFTGMGFAAIACVTRDHWITCQVEDSIELGLEPGGELAVKTTICNDIRDCGEVVAFDDAVADERWRRHPAPILYGFRSYASFPVLLDDGTFFGTLCALDPEPRRITADHVMELFRKEAEKVARIVSEILAPPPPVPDPARRAAYDAGLRRGVRTEAWAGECPYDGNHQAALRTAWMSGFGMGRIEAGRRSTDD